MELALADVLRTALADKIYNVPEKGEMKLFDLVSDWEDGLAKTQTCNKDIANQRKELRDQVDKLTKSNQELLKIKDELEEKVKQTGSSKDDKEKIKTEYEKKLNALQDQLNEIGKKFTEAQRSAEESTKKVKETTRANEETKLRADVFSALSKYKITGGQADALYLLMREKGTIAIEEDENGGYRRNFTIEKEGRKYPGDIETIAKTFAEANPWAVASSGKSGTGDEHQGKGAMGKMQFTGKESLDQLKSEFHSNL